MHKRYVIPVLSAAGLLAALSVFLIRHPVSVSTETEWAIAIYEGPSYTRLSPAQAIPSPVLRRTDVTDVKADFVADPFLARRDGRWYMFFEVMNALTGHGDIGCAVSGDGLRWTYDRIVLDEPFHLSYPYVFTSRGRYYMIPESAEAGDIRLYEPADFPYSWKPVASLVKGSFADTCVFEKDGTWWMLTCSRPRTHDELSVYFADALTGPWTAHPQNPVVRDGAAAQPGGRVLLSGGKVVRFGQDSVPTYGKRLRAFVVTTLSRTAYAERECGDNPVVGAGGRGWNRHGMHHVDAWETQPGRWIAAVDGYRKHIVLRLEY